MFGVGIEIILKIAARVQSHGIYFGEDVVQT
jgi:hypothetical protein